MSGRTGSTFKPRRGGVGAGITSTLERMFRTGGGTTTTTDIDTVKLPTDADRPPGNPETWTDKDSKSGWNKALQNWIEKRPLLAKALGGLGRGAGGLLAAYFMWRDMSSAVGLWLKYKDPDDKWPFGSDPADEGFKQAMIYLMTLYGMSMYGAIAGATLLSPLLPPAGSILGGILGGGASFLAGDWIWRHLLGDPEKFMDHDADLLGTEGKKSMSDFFQMPAKSGSTFKPKVYRAPAHLINKQPDVSAAAGAILQGGPQYDNIYITEHTYMDASQRSVSHSSDNKSITVNQHTAQGGIGSRPRFGP